MIKWIRTSRLSIQNSLSLQGGTGSADAVEAEEVREEPDPLIPAPAEQVIKSPCSVPLLGTGARKNPAACGTHQGNSKRRFGPERNSFRWFPHLLKPSVRSWASGSPSQTQGFKDVCLKNVIVKQHLAQIGRIDGPTEYLS